MRASLARFGYPLPIGWGEGRVRGLHLKTLLPATKKLITNLRMISTARARQLRKKQTWAEKALWRLLRDRRFSGYKFRRQHPFGDYFLDFYCAEAKLVLETDGFMHGHPERQKHDAQ